MKPAPIASTTSRTRERGEGRPREEQAIDDAEAGWRNRGFTKAAGAAGLLDWDEESKIWVGDFRPYDLRHTCASMLIRAHVPPADAAAQLGTSLELLFRTYSHSIEAMRGRPATSIADAIHRARGTTPDAEASIRSSRGGIERR